MEPKPDVGTVYAVIRTTVVVDLWARLLSITIKAVLAVVSVSGNSSGGAGSSSNATGLCARGRLAVCGHGVRGGFRGGGGAEGGTRRRESPLPRGGRSSTFDIDDVNSGGNGDRRGGGGGGAGSGTRRAWRVCLCCSERYFGGPYRFGRLPASGGDGNDAGEAGGRDGSRAGGTGILLSRAGRQVRERHSACLGETAYIHQVGCITKMSVKNCENRNLAEQQDPIDCLGLSLRDNCEKSHSRP